MERLSIDEIISDFECDAKENRIDLDISYAEKNEQVAKWLKELKAYQDAEEQELLLRLPCKVGDKVWAITSNISWYEERVLEHPQEKKIQSITISKNGILYHVKDRTYGTLDFGKTVFLTKEEAEQKLASMQKGE